MKKKDDLRAMVDSGKLIKIVGAHNGLTAKLVEEAGFDGVWASGFEISTSHAVPDANILTMTDFLHASEDMVNAITIPLIADCDTGFGNSNNVIQMVRKFEAAGVSAVCIEDKEFPKVNSFICGRQDLASVAEFVGKIMAAKNAQISEKFMVFARVEALIAGWGQTEALKRAEAYLEAGADGIFIHSKLNSSDEIINFCKAWKKRGPLLISPTTYCLEEKELSELGVNIVIYANQAIRAAVKHVREVLEYLREHGTFGIESKISSMEEVFYLQGMHIMKNNEKKYLKSGIGTIKAIIPAAGEKMDESIKLLLEDRPVGMLDINGKSLLQRNIETLNIVGVQDINVIVGYKGDEVKLEGAKVIANSEFKEKGLMHSIIRGADPIADRNIILYSDIIVDKHILQKLIHKDGDIVLVVDRTYKKTHIRDKELELVEVESPPPDNLRVIDTNRKNIVSKIGRNLPEDKAHFEYIGLALLSRKGMEAIIREYEKASFSGPVSFVDFIQHLLEQKYEIFIYEVSEGWMEIHNFNDYKQACLLFS